MKLQEILDVIVSIKFSLLKKESKIINNKAAYSKKKSVKFVIPVDFPRDEESLKWMCSDMFQDLRMDMPNANYIGVWIEYKVEGIPITIDNALSLKSLDEMKMYSKDPDISPAYEFFKMTLPVTSDEEGSLQSSGEDAPIV